MTNTVTGELSLKQSSGFKLKNPIIIIGILFFVFGFITWLGSVLIPYLKIVCQLNGTEPYYVAFSLYISYAIMAIPSAWVLKKIGFKNGMFIGLLIVAAGTLLFIPAAKLRLYGLFLAGLYVQGTGLAILQTAANPYITILGPPESAARRVSMMGVCNGIASSLSPIILGALILNDTDSIKNKLSSVPVSEKNILLDDLASRVVGPYLVMMVVLIAVALLVKFSGLPETHEEEDAGFVHTKKTGILGFPHLLIGVFTLFLYVGVEVIAGDTIINYGSFQGISLSTAKFFTSATQVNMLIGYIIGIICIPKYISQEKALRYSAILAIIFALIAIFTKGYLSITFIALLGLANSLMWPSIWPLAIAGLGRFTKLGSSFLIMAIGGGAILPLLYGHLATKFNPQQAYWMVIPCYLAVFYYAVWGHKIRISEV
ncbi:MAG: glucose/galactose transporter [Chitinophagaceae bacterium]|nr:glucose/galactose transporter [Chitinophagaceae bacterium]